MEDSTFVTIVGILAITVVAAVTLIMGINHGTSTIALMILCGALGIAFPSPISKKEAV
jgi:hypothetical protein